MSDTPSTRPEVPEGGTRYLVTRQKKPTEKGYVGYETTWEPFQKEVKYTTPKRPRLCENPEFELPVENSCQYSLTLAQLWSDPSIVSVILNLKCRSIPIKQNIIEFSHRLGHKLPGCANPKGRAAANSVISLQHFRFFSVLFYFLSSEKLTNIFARQIQEQEESLNGVFVLLICQIYGVNCQSIIFHQP